MSGRVSTLLKLEGIQLEGIKFGGLARLKEIFQGAFSTAFSAFVRGEIHLNHLFGSSQAFYAQ